jgi:hypothetical protein
MQVISILIGLFVAVYTFSYGWEIYKAGNRFGAAGVSVLGAACVAIPIYFAFFH